MERLAHAGVVVGEESAGEVGHAARHDGVLRVRGERDAFDDGEGADDERKVGRDDDHVVLPLLLQIVLQAEDLLRDAARADVAHAATADQLPHHLLQDGLHIQVAEIRVPLGDKAQSDQVVRDAVPVLQTEVRDVLHQRQPLLLRHFAHQTVVQDGDAAVRRAQQVAWVGVGVQEARLQQLDEVGVEDGVAEREHVVRAALAQLLPRDPRGGEDVSGGKLGEDLRHHHPLQPRHVPLERHRVVRLQLVVHLLEEAERPVVQHRGPVAVHEWEGAQELAVAAQQVNVQRGLSQHIGPLHLHSHLATAVTIQQAALVHLPQTCCRHRLLRQPLKGLRYGRAQLGGDQPVRLLRVKRLHVVLQAAEGVDVGGREDVGARGQRLPHLNVGGAERLHDLASLLRPPRNVGVPRLERHVGEQRRAKA
mmetsp:Transcript_41278/g.74208  ORF Transcript_41278/g.74208 Transcript_41278/m.74208 type:complete len:421 (-) Transcript_41278:1231-2493(-)